ncbi:hypothetical protein [Ciceribacter azotifigens]|uniref:hypothetical protein n=1 Tax=Ciceribacter azotifigens TaxID=2069303 RepID=UPI003A877481
MRRLRDFGRMAWLVLVVAAALAFAGAPGASAHQVNCGSVVTVATDGAHHQHHHTKSDDSTAAKAAAVPCCTTACPLCVSAAGPAAAAPHAVAFLHLAYPERQFGLSGSEPPPDFEPPRPLA